jgi:uncharacterized protein YhbP (UPF0306 family)
MSPPQFLDKQLKFKSQMVALVKPWSYQFFYCTRIKKENLEIFVERRTRHILVSGCENYF